MSRALLLAPLLVAAASAAIAPDSPDHANHFQADPIIVGDVTASASSAWARQAEAKLRVEFENGTDDFLLVKKDAARLTMASGEFQAGGKDTFDVVDPNGQGSHTFVFADEAGKLHADAMTAQLEGVYLAATDAPPIQAEPFTLPLTRNEIKAGGFTCRSKGKISQETQETKAKFECTYQGAPGTVGLLTSEAITFAIPSGDAFANEEGKPMKLLLPGDTATFQVKNTVIKPKPHGVDMQFTELKLLWNDALRSVELQQLAFPAWDFTLDATLTAEKNQ